MLVYVSHFGEGIFLLIAIVMQGFSFHVYKKTSKPETQLRGLMYAVRR